MHIYRPLEVAPNWLVPLLSLLLELACMLAVVHLMEL